MKDNLRKIDLSRVVASPVLTGSSPKYMWTGVVRANHIDEILIKDESKRESFKKLVREFENLILKCRQNNSNSVLQVKVDDFLEQDTAMENDILRLGRKIKEVLNNPDSGIDMDLFWVFLCRDYEAILFENPEELKHMDQNSRKALENFRNFIEKTGLRVREVYNPDEKHYKAVIFPTRGQEKAFPDAKKNKEKLVEIVKSCSDKKELSEEEYNKLLKEILTGILLSDLKAFISDPNYLSMIYIAFLKNYMLSVGYKAEEIDEMNVEQLEDIALKDYNSSNIDSHTTLMANTINDIYEYMDIEALGMAVMFRPLLSYAEMRLSGVRLIDGEIQDAREEIETEIKESGQIIQSLDEETIKEQMIKTEKMIKNILALNIVSRKKKVLLAASGKEQYVSVQTIENFLEHYCDGIFLNDVMKVTLMHRALLTQNVMDEWSDELLERLNLNNQDIMLLSLVDFENMKRLNKLEMIDKSNVFDIVSMLHDNEIDSLDLQSYNILAGQEENEEVQAKILENLPSLLISLINYGIITPQDLVEYYNKRLINIGDLNLLRNEENLNKFLSQMSDSIDENLLLNCYKDYILEKLRYEKALRENDPDVDMFKELTEFRKREKDSLLILFKKYKVAFLSPEEVKELSEDMLMYYCVELIDDNQELINESLREMYRDGIVGFEEIKNTDESYLQSVLIDTMLVRGELTLEDTRKLRESLPYETLINIMNTAILNKNITETEKFTLIMNVFHMHTAEDEKARQMFLNKLTLEKYDGVKYPELETQGEIYDEPMKREKGSTGETSKEYVYPKHIKWEFLNALDKDAIITVYTNGYVEAYSKKLGVRIIEKYFDVGENGFSDVKDAYGVSTYILSDDTYRENEEYLIENYDGVNKRLNRKMLTLIVPKKDRIRHNTHSQDKNWMRSMAKYFDIDLSGDIALLEDTRYSKEELKVIRETIIAYENLYIER